MAYLLLNGVITIKLCNIVFLYYGPLKLFFKKLGSLRKVIPFFFRCEHNLSKPEYNPTSIKFKIQLAAYYHVPGNAA